MKLSIDGEKVGINEILTIRIIAYKKNKPTNSYIDSKSLPTYYSISDKHTDEIPPLINCTLEEERYIIECLAYEEIKKLNKHEKFIIELDDEDERYY